MQLLMFLGSRQFRWPCATALILAAFVSLIATRAESGAPFAMTLLAAFVAWDG